MRFQSRRPVVRLLLSLSATIIALLLAEGAVRVLGLAPEVTRIELGTPYGAFVESDNPILKYVPRASSGDINSLGFRDQDVSPTKPEGTFRIVVIGDSVGFGFCTDTEVLASERTFPKILEGLLNATRFSRFARVEVLNLCVSGYDTIQEVEFLREKGLALSPDLVIVAYCLNDNLDCSAELPAFEKPSMMARAGRGLYKILFLQTHLFRFVVCRIPVTAGRPAVAGPPDPGVDRLHRGFRCLRELADSHRFQALVVVFPAMEEYSTYRYAHLHQDVARAAAGERFWYLDLFPAFWTASQGDFRRMQGRCVREHPDETGHTVAAWAIRDTIIANRLVPGGQAH